MFSVEDEPNREPALFSYSSLSFGWELGDFTFQGDPDQTAPDRFDFNDGILKVQFENPGIDMYFGIAGRLTGSENQNYLNIGATISNDFILNRSGRFWFILPLQLNTDLKRSQTEASSNQFQQSAFQLGAGLGLKTQISEQLNAVVRLVPNYGFSNSQGSFVGGTVFSLKGMTRVYLENIFANRAIVLGYDYRYRSYNIDGELFDYDYRGHSLTLGFTF
ncbi:MAG: hypothetical protein WEC12_06570 [Balneolaceae bacterium]